VVHTLELGLVGKTHYMAMEYVNGESVNSLLKRSKPSFILSARIVAEAAVLEDGIMIPQRCIMELQGMFRVFVVDGGNRITLRDVAVGPTIRDFRVILEGLEAGEKIVYEGLQKVRPGMEVNPVIQDVEPVDTEEK